MDTVDAEVVEEHGQELVAVTLATVLVTPEEARQQNEQINAVISEVLKEGKSGDYWQIPGTPAPTLLQPGAETLQRFFGLGRKLGEPVKEMIEVDGKQFFSCEIKCSITNPADRVIAESYGYCDDTEAKRNSGPGTKWRGNRHTIIQIATKRAYVSAIKTATGTSQHFTADLEDQQDAAPAAKPLVEDRMPSDDEKLLLAGLYAQKHPAGVTLAEAMEWVASYKAKADSRNWVAIQVLGLMMRPDPMPAEAMPKDDTVPIVIPGQTEIRSQGRLNRV